MTASLASARRATALSSSRDCSALGNGGDSREALQWIQAALIDTVLPERANRRINAANGTRIKEHGVKQVRFRTREGQKQDWKMLVADVKKELKSVATTCDGDGGGECHVLFTRHGGTIVNVSDVDKSNIVKKVGLVRGAGELTAFDQTGNTYGMKAWACVDQSDKASVGFVRPAAAP